MQDSDSITADESTQAVASNRELCHFPSCFTKGFDLFNHLKVDEWSDLTFVYRIKRYLISNPFTSVICTIICVV